MYKLQSATILRLSDGASIPQDPANVDYAKYLIWCSEGNIPESVDPLPIPDPKEAIKAQIDILERKEMLPRLVREYMLADAEQKARALGIDPMTNYGYARLKEFDQLISSLREQL